MAFAPSVGRKARSPEFVGPTGPWCLRDIGAISPSAVAVATLSRIGYCRVLRDPLHNQEKSCHGAVLGMCFGALCAPIRARLLLALWANRYPRALGPLVGASSLLRARPFS